MSAPKLSSEGNCPTCGSDHWKSAEMIFLEGSSTFESDSDGGGANVSAGLGQGKGGIDVGYQSINFQTTGEEISALAEKCSPPLAPAFYQDLPDLIKSCLSAITNSKKIIDDINKFAIDEQKLNRSSWEDNPDTLIANHKKDYDQASKKILACRSYAQQKILWKRTQICQRCSESYINNKTPLNIEVNINIPDFKFPGVNDKCPQCHSYQWKDLELYFSIQVKQKTTLIEKAKCELTESISFEAKKSNASLWELAKGKVLLKTPEKARLKLQKLESELTEIRQNRIEVIESVGQLMEQRACLCCDFVYKKA